MLVVPASVAPRLRYSLCAVALAFALWAKVDGESTAPARLTAARDSAQLTGVPRWRQLRRWMVAITQRRIFPRLSRLPDPTDSVVPHTPS